MALMTPGDGVISACLDLLYNLPIVNRLAYKLLLNSGFAFFRIFGGKISVPVNRGSIVIFYEVHSMSLTALMAFALIMSAGIITPGPTVLLSLNNAARFGIKRALWGISGAVVADVLLVALVWLGLGVVLAASETLFVTLSNPKYYIFMTALLPQFVNMTQPALPQYACLATVIVSIDVTVMLSYAALGKKSVRIWKANGIRWMNRISGTFLLILAGSVALYRKSST